MGDNMKVGKADVKTDTPAHVRGVREENAPDREAR